MEEIKKGEDYISDLLKEATGVFIASHGIIESCHGKNTLHQKLREEGKMDRE